MGRREHERLRLTLSGGLDEGSSRADPRETLSACDNVWAPNGVLQSRPGYVQIRRIHPDSVTTANDFLGRLEAVPDDGSESTYTDIDGDGLIALDSAIAETNGDYPPGSLVAGDRVYIGRTTAQGAWDGGRLDITIANGNNTVVRAEYWNGTTWAGLSLTLASAASGLPEAGFLRAVGQCNLLFTAPQDWTATTVNATEGYWIRLRLKHADIDGTCTLDWTGASTGTYPDSNIVGAIAAQFSAGTRYLFVQRTADSDNPTGNQLLFDSCASLLGQDALRFTLTRTERDGVAPDLPASIAFAPEARLIYVAHNSFITVHRCLPLSTDDVEALAATGTANIFSKALVDQFAYVPRAKFVSWFKRRLWYAHTQTGDIGPYEIGWTGDYPFHDVYPTAQFAAAADADNSPITALHPLGNHMMVFKNDSIWLMVEGGAGEEPRTLLFDAEKIVDGVGCVAHRSIQPIRGMLVFLAEGGLYGFDGTPNIRKISEGREGDRLVDVYGKIDKSRRAFAVSAHWHKHSLYLLAYRTRDNTSSTTHNQVLVWDYKNNSFWTWSNIDAQHWLSDESGDEERLYFIDSIGGIYELGVGYLDHGATITATCTTQRLGEGGSQRKTLREIRAVSTNKTRALSLTPVSNDTAQTALTLTLTDGNETDWGSSFVWPTSGTQASYTAVKRRERRVDTRWSHDWCQVTLSHSTKAQPMELAYLEVGLVPLGRR